MQETEVKFHFLLHAHVPAVNKQIALKIVRFIPIASRISDSVYEFED